MKCRITRTSNSGSNEQPCSEAVYARNGKKDEYDWFVEFNDLDELMAFCVQYGEVIVSPSTGDDVWGLEIYDYYRE